MSANYTTVHIIIPCRKNSQGLPGKHMLPITDNMRVIDYACSAAVKFKRKRPLVDGPVFVHLYTDDSMLSGYVRCAYPDIEHPKRDPSDATHDASTEEALQNALHKITPGAEDTIVLLQATNIFVTARDIKHCVDQSIKCPGSTVFTATPGPRHVWGAIGTHHHVWRVNTPLPRKRRQDMPNFCTEDGAVYAFRLDDFDTDLGRSRFCGQLPQPFIVQRPSIEIDDYSDYIAARAVMQWQNAREANTSDQHAPPTDKLDTPRCSPIDTLLLDFDGIFTDNTIMFNTKGIEDYAVSKYDSLAITVLKRTGVRVIIVTTETSRAVQLRADKMDVELWQGSAKTHVLKELNLTPDRTAFLGHDYNDLPLLRAVGFPFWPKTERQAQFAPTLKPYIIHGEPGQNLVRRACAQVASINGTDLWSTFEED